MTHEQAKIRIEKLKQVIDKYRYEQHVLDALSISDAALDALKHELYTLEQRFPDLISSDSPTQRVAGKPAEGFRKVSHAKPSILISAKKSKAACASSRWSRSSHSFNSSNVNTSSIESIGSACETLAQQ
jgi:DNA ligase (NAD+)